MEELRRTRVPQDDPTGAVPTASRRTPRRGSRVLGEGDLQAADEADGQVEEEGAERGQRGDQRNVDGGEDPGHTQRPVQAEEALDADCAAGLPSGEVARRAVDRGE